MESEESPLRPCKLLPLPFKDLDTLQNRISPNLGTTFFTQGEMEQGITGPAKDIVDGGFVTQDCVIRQEDKIASPQMGNEQETAASFRKKGSLNLLNLPLDILKDIFKEVSAKGSTL